MAAITDPDAIRFENGDNIREDRLEATTATKLQCLRSAVTARGGVLSVNSAWRPQAYQNHLREIVDKLAAIDKHRSKPACKVIYNELVSEKSRHGLGTVVGLTSRHTLGTAFDANWTGISTVQLDLLAAACNLSRPILNDPIHFE